MFICNNFSRELYFEAGNIYYFIIDTTEAIDIDHVTLEWKYVVAFNPIAWRVKRPPAVMLDSLFIQSPYET